MTLLSSQLLIYLFFFLKLISFLQNSLGLFFSPPVRFRSITEQYYRKADGILAMYDLTDVSSFTAVRGWMDSVQVSPAMQSALSRFEYARHCVASTVYSRVAPPP